MSSSANRPPPGFALRLGASLALALGLLAACAVGPDFHRPAPPRTATYGPVPPPAVVAGDGARQALRPDGPASPDWWTAFRSPTLDALVEDGLRHSATLAQAVAVLTEAKQTAQAGAGVYVPQLGLNAAADRERSTPLRLGVQGAPTTFSLYTLSASVSYAVDLFGGERRRVEALNAGTDRARQSLAAARLLLEGNIADAAIARAGYEAEAESLAMILALERDQRDMLQAQYAAGRVGIGSLDLIVRQIAADEAARLAVVQRRDAAAGLVQQLLGREPGEARPDLPALDGLRVPGQLPAVLPSDVVRVRPDILEKEAALHQASAEVGVAEAALFPSIALTGDAGQANTALSHLGDPAGRFWSVGPSVTVPLVSGGTLWFGRKAAAAAWRAAAADYRQTVLAALEQVSDALRAVETDAKVADARRAAFDSAGLDQRLADVTADAGVTGAYDAGTARIALERARLDLIDARTQRLQDAVALFLATGGGWSAEARR